MKPKISIVVPIYNVEKFINRCFDSLISQSLKAIEIIAINDGSTDKSLDIVNEYAVKDARIIVVDKKNGGVSSARNVGIELAKGDYLGFVDPDDWIETDMYEAMYQTAIEDKADIVMCSYKSEFGSHSKEKNFHLPKKVSFIDQDVRLKVMRRLIGPLNEEISKPELLDAWGTVWSKLYRAEIIKENKITFTDLEIIGTNEDTLFNIETLYYTKKFIFLNQPYYHYWRGNSESITSRFKPSLKDNYSLLYKLIHQFLIEKGLGPEYYSALNNRISLNTLGLGFNEISKDNKSSILMKINRLKNILSDKQIQESYKQLEMSYFSFVWKLFYLCAKTKNAIGVYFMLSSINLLRKIVR
ncbi:glycosyl transferase family 2 [Oceanobacillus arenosus]|uniref:Glycosyl transferase family 2 n=1 Tax=Oceanobacillus arenosus TaxID=1229153 RepID=A0A3D8Q2R9_9BACI|nr:glycosyltransferase [Oceanobacillus arenosus]RDW22412.1 glycosyl transferase family 2 [Oceanobacillus arenosus]